MYKISIIIPVYNVESYVEDCLQSVANQTMTEGVECIIVDDCGKDKSVHLAKEFIRNYKGDIRFSLIHREKNGGLSAARNTGIEAALGEYLYFLDSDDEITPNCMELMWGLVEKHGKVDLVQGSFYETEKEHRIPSYYQIPEYTDNTRIIKSFLLKYDGDIVAAQSRLVKKDYILQHNLFFKEGIIHEDNYWTFFLAKHIKSMAFCPVRTYYHRYNPTSITGNRNIEKEILAYKTIITDLSANIDPFLPGHQKELILNTLLTALNSHYYKNEIEKKHLIYAFVLHNSIIERFLLYCILKVNNNWINGKILHLLVRIYKFKDL